MSRDFGVSSPFAGRESAMPRLESRSLAVAFLFASAVPVPAQNTMQGVDLNSPMMTTAEMSRQEVAAAIEAAAAGAPVNVSGRRLSGLDLSGLDLSRAVLRGAIRRVRKDVARLLVYYRIP